MMAVRGLPLCVLFFSGALAPADGLRAGSEIARVGSRWSRFSPFVSPISLDFSPFALTQNFPSAAFATAPPVAAEQPSPSVTLLLDDLCHTVGYIGTIGAEVGVTLRYLRLPSTGQVKVIALGSRAALHIFVKKARQTWSEDLRVTWAKS